ncbi:conserved membrane hypothetical protein [Pseudomonas sp. 8AS]|uniref:hypothetical protein n=1 Tax=Pseudomonas sp. 8AS TaxID=2653163 RepID=UPI0012F04C61|nr:hypothetical protein [Pseudomonas sp. 8AS]VXB94576.1 conserved membrane hypothetical protein [Pseudomonas sp. 8AS]
MRRLPSTSALAETCGDERPLSRTWLWHGLSLFSLLSCAGWALLGGLYTLQVQDVGGTLLGGIGGALALLALLAALAGLGLAWLLGMSGARQTWGLTFLLLGGLALKQWLGYPAEHVGYLILSPSREELSGYVLICAIALFTAVLLPRRRLATPGRLRWMLGAGLALSCLYSLLLLLGQVQSNNLPYCAFDADSGQQLTICLGDEPRVLID